MSEKDNNTNVQKETDKLFDLKVLEVKNTLPEIKLPRPVDPRLPTIPGLVLFVARCRSGKSNFIMNYLFSENYLGGKVNVFDVIYYVSPTCRMDKSTQVLFREDLEDKVIVFEDIDNVDAFIQNILDYQESFPVNDEDNPRPLVCIVLDDISGALKRSSATTHLCSRYRHYNIHLIISNQTLRDLPTVCRSMADSVFLAQTTSVMERQKVMEEYGDLYKNKLLPAWDEASAEQYHFAYLKLDELVPKIYKIGPSGCNEIDYNKYEEVMPSDLERKNKKRRGRKKKNNIVIEKNE